MNESTGLLYGSALERRINPSIFQVIDAIGIYLHIGQMSYEARSCEGASEAVYQDRGGSYRRCAESRCSWCAGLGAGRAGRHASKKTRLNYRSDP
jgi:hypothetical protein